jgi:hypothetical protein
MADIRSRKQKVAAPKAWHDARALCNFSRLFVWLAVRLAVVDTRDGTATRDRFQIRKDFHVVILIHEPDASQLLTQLAPNEVKKASQEASCYVSRFS